MPVLLFSLIQVAVTRMVIPLVMLSVAVRSVTAPVRAVEVLSSTTAKTVGGQREATRRGAVLWRTHRCTVTASKVLWTQGRDRGTWGMSKTVRLELMGLSDTDDDELLSLGSQLRRSLL